MVDLQLYRRLTLLIVIQTVYTRAGESNGKLLRNRPISSDY